MKTKTLLPVLFALLLGVMVPLPLQIAKADEKKEPTLDETYKWLTEKIQEFGGYHYVFDDTDITVSYQVLKADGSTFVFKQIEDSVSKNNKEHGRNSTIVTVPMSEIDARCDPSTDESTRPKTLYFLSFRAEKKVIKVKHVPGQEFMLDSTQIAFVSEDTANRVLKAINHVIQLCKADEPF